MIGNEAVVALVTMSLFLVVMLVVPWLVAGEPASDALPTREVRLWVALGLVQFTIWSTLGPAQILASALRDRGILVAASGAVSLIAAVIAVGLWRRRRRGVLESVAAIGIASAYVMVLVRSGLSPEDRTHLFEYGIVAILAFEALSERRRTRQATLRPWPIALILAISLGIIDEVVQRFVPNRVFDPRDIVFNSIAVTMALTSVAVMGAVRRFARERGVSR